MIVERNQPSRRKKCFFFLHFSSHYPWPDDDSCKLFDISFAPQNALLPTVGLVSYPSSGNTWLRYLVEAVTGVFSGSMYHDIMLKKEGEKHKDYFLIKRWKLS